MNSVKRLLLACAIVSVPAAFASAAPAFSDNFDDGQAATRWTSVNFNANSTVNYAFDYTNVLSYDGVNTIGVPNPAQTTHTGLQLTSNQGTPSGISGINVYANDLNATGRVVLTFDMYFRFVEAAGSSQYVNFGVAHSTTTGTFTSLTGGTTTSGIWFTDGADGAGTSTDYRAYESNTHQTGAGAVARYLGGSQSNGTTGWQTLFPDLDGAATLNQAGASGNQWVNTRVTYDSTTGEILWEMKKVADADYTIAYTYTDPTITQTGGTITLGLTDPFASATPAGTYIIYDNVVVTVPEPAALGIAAPAALALLTRRRRA